MDKGSWSRFLKEYNPLKAGSIDGTDTRPHDKGIERALEAVYVPNKDLQSDPTKTLFVSRLNPETTEETLYMTFSKYGEIKSLSLIRDIVTGFSKRYAFVEYNMHGDAEEACEEMHCGYLDNHSIFVEWECGRTLPGWIPRRLGGGFGGKKESGQLRFGGKDRPFKKPLRLGGENKGSWRGEKGAERFDRNEQSGSRRGGSRERDKYETKDRYEGRDRDRSQGYGRGERDGGYREKDRLGDRESHRSVDRTREKDRDRYRRMEEDQHEGRGSDKYKGRERDIKKEPIDYLEEGECSSGGEKDRKSGGFRGVERSSVVERPWKKRRFMEVKVEKDT